MTRAQQGFRRGGVSASHPPFSTSLSGRREGNLLIALDVWFAVGVPVLDLFTMASAFRSNNEFIDISHN